MPSNDNYPRGNHFSNSAASNSQNTTPRGNVPVGRRFASAEPVVPMNAATRQSNESANRPKSTVPASYSSYGSPYGAQPSGSPRDGKKNRKKTVGIVVGVLLALFLLFGGATGFILYKDAKDLSAKSHTVIETAKTLKDSLKEGNGEALREDAREIAWEVSEMKNTVNSPVWKIASFIPVYGSDVRLAQDLLNEVDNLAQNALVPACDSLGDFKLGNLLHDGAVDLDLLNTLITTMQDVEPVVTQSAEVIDALPEAHIGKVNDLLAKIKDPMSSAVDGLKQVNELAPLLPQMLGADAPRNYLITAENNAEIRAQGGFAGALGIMTVDHGVISLNEFEGTLTMGADGPTSAITISDEEMQLFQPEAQTLNYTSGDSYLVPDFPRGAQLVSTLWSIKHGGQHVDGVVALDPVFLQYLLQLTGGITAVDGMQVDGTNAASALLSLTYWNYPEDGEMQDAVFASVAKGAFEKLLGGLGDVGFQRLFAVIQRGGVEGRLLMWMANEDEEGAIKKLGMDGSLPTEANNPQTGLYVNNYSYSKLDWYLNIDAQLGEPVTQSDGSTAYTVNATLTNELPLDQAGNLPKYVTAHSPFADNLAQEMLRLYLYAPFGGSITDVNCSYGQMTEATHNNLQVMYEDIRMSPGESVTVSYTVIVPAGAEGELELRVTPTAQYARKGTAGDATTPGTVQGQVAEG